MLKRKLRNISGWFAQDFGVLIVPIVVLIIGLTYGSLKFTLIAMPVSYLLAIVISDYESEIYQLQTINLSETEVIKNKEEPYLVPDCYHKKVEEGS